MIARDREVRENKEKKKVIWEKKKREKRKRERNAVALTLEFPLEFFIQIQFLSYKFLVLWSESLQDAPNVLKKDLSSYSRNCTH